MSCRSQCKVIVYKSKMKIFNDIICPGRKKPLTIIKHNLRFCESNRFYQRVWANFPLLALPDMAGYYSKLRQIINLF
jgi:hypothetical protein